MLNAPLANLPAERERGQLAAALNAIRHFQKTRLELRLRLLL